ncbi:EamA family transporter [Micromonospora sp. WMMD1102]|uniref:EamA family transporter n=1 Tax=Micromonospora sp. WMMD1102 TaxID=3016105 RepID=UPI0024150BA8|nr:EamA family transporter [Micromonospora sp. WMMD1102]MDG4790684.1 EamA family transporter [Micromonospora sp. WMMD1102]
MSGTYTCAVGPSGARPAPGGARRLAALVGPDAVPPPLLMLLGMVSTQVGAAIATGLFRTVSPGGTTALRLGFGALVLVAVVRPTLRLGPRAAGLVAAFGVAMAGMNLAFYTALQRVPLGVAVTIAFTGPLLVSVAASRRARDVGWVLLAGLGVALLAGLLGPGGGAGPLDGTALAWCGLVALGWAGYVVFGKAVSTRLGGSRGLALGMVVGAVCVLPFGVAGSGAALFDPWTLTLGLGVALLSSVLPYSAEMAALRRMPARVFAVLLSLEPAVAALVGLTLLHETLGWPQLLGIGCVVAASLGALTARSGRSERSG